jgi:RimJ/RimL family protein N-acetyltransferase
VTVDIPTLETERLLLRGWRETDLDAYAAMMADAQVMRFLGGPMARADAWRGMASLIGHWLLRGHGVWAVERKSDGALVGRIGVQRPEGWPATEVAWILGRPYWGQGYATEAARASLDWGFANLAVPKLVSLIDSENLASRAVAKRLGYTKGSPATLFALGKSFDVEVWEIPRARWRSEGDATATAMQ